VTAAHAWSSAIFQSRVLRTRWTLGSLFRCYRRPASGLKGARVTCFQIWAAGSPAWSEERNPHASPSTKVWSRNHDGEYATDVRDGRRHDTAGQARDASPDTHTHSTFGPAAKTLRISSSTGTRILGASMFARRSANRLLRFSLKLNR